MRAIQDRQADALDRVYQRLREIAGGYISKQSGGTLQPTALVHEAVLKVLCRANRPAGGDDTDLSSIGEPDATEGMFESTAHLVAYVARAMKTILIDTARRRSTRDRALRVVVHAGSGAAGDEEFDILGLDEALEELAAADPRAAEVVTLRFFGSLTMAQIASVLNVSESTVQSDWRCARAWLQARLSGWGGESP